jgi:hypothetical protein
MQSETVGTLRVYIIVAAISPLHPAKGPRARSVLHWGGALTTIVDSELRELPRWSPEVWRAWHECYTAPLTRTVKEGVRRWQDT